MRDFVDFIKRLFGKGQKRLPCPVAVGYVRIKPFYDRSDSYWE